MLQVIKEWGIQDNLSYFMIDNTDNNDTIMANIALNKGLLFLKF